VAFTHFTTFGTVTLRLFHGEAFLLRYLLDVFERLHHFKVLALLRWRVGRGTAGVVELEFSLHHHLRHDSRGARVAFVSTRPRKETK
jgi:hypothetical protein